MTSHHCFKGLKAVAFKLSFPHFQLLVLTLPSSWRSFALLLPSSTFRLLHLCCRSPQLLLLFRHCCTLLRPVFEPVHFARLLPSSTSAAPPPLAPRPPPHCCSLLPCSAEWHLDHLFPSAPAVWIQHGRHQPAGGCHPRLLSALQCDRVGERRVQPQGQRREVEPRRVPLSLGRTRGRHERRCAPQTDSLSCGEQACPRLKPAAFLLGRQA